jgi:hypothetical protein
MSSTGYSSTGYNVSPPREVWDLMRHRRRQLDAIRRKARADDETERELQQLDADIAAGVERLESMEKSELEKLGVALRRAIDEHSS